MDMKRQIIIIVIIAATGLLFANYQYTTLNYKIVGTNVTACYDNLNVITCPVSSSAPFYGQNQGITPSYQNNGNGTISDMNTGLMWIQARGVKVTWDSAFILASQCNIGGFTDWRVPTIKELYSLIDFNGRSAPTSNMCIPYIDSTFFGWKTGDTTIGERVIDAQDWSATKYKALTMQNDSTIFGVNFVDGRIKGYPQYQPGSNNTIKHKLYVRFVRGNTNYGINNFLDNGDSTITDNATGLMWSKNDSRIGMNWQSALAWVQTKNTANYLGYNDWRLPTAKELQSIVDYTRCKDFTNSAAIDPVFNTTQISDEGGNVNWPFNWSNTTHRDNMGGVYVCFGESLGWMKPMGLSYYILFDVHGAGAQRSDPKSGSYTNYFLGYNQSGQPVYGLGPQGDVIRINNYVRLVRTAFTTGINNQEVETSGSYKLNQNFPNPFNPVTTISYYVPKSSLVKLTVFSLLGKEIETLLNEQKQAGYYTAKWNASNFPSGIYFCRMQAEGFKSDIKMILLR